MRDIATLQRVIFSLKREHNITVKELANTLGMSYTYLTRQANGNTRFSDATYDKVMDFARKKGINTTVLTTREYDTKSDITIPGMVMEPPIPFGSKYEIVVRIQMNGQDITGVAWDKVAQ